MHDIYLYFFITILFLLNLYIKKYIGAYAKKKGENIATKEDFNELLEQQKKLTLEAETIKASINSNFSQLENKRIHLQNKLEETCFLIVELASWVETYTNKHILTTHEHRIKNDSAEAKKLQAENAIVHNEKLEKIKALCLIYFNDCSEVLEKYRTRYFLLAEIILKIDFIDSSATEEAINSFTSENKLFLDMGVELIDSLIKNNQKITEMH